MDCLLGVLVSSIIAKLNVVSLQWYWETLRTHPNVISLFHELERQTSLFIRQAHPNLTVHEQAVVHIYDILPYAIFPIVHFLVLFSFSPCKTMQSQEVAISGLYNMLLRVVSEERT